MSLSVPINDINIQWNNIINELLYYVQKIIQWCGCSEIIIEYNNKWIMSKEFKNWILYFTITCIRELENILNIYKGEINMYYFSRHIYINKDLHWFDLLQEIMNHAFPFNEDDSIDKKNLIRQTQKSEINKIIDNISKSTQETVNITLRSTIESDSVDTFIEKQFKINIFKFKYLFNNLNNDIVITLMQHLSLNDFETILNKIKIEKLVDVLKELSIHDFISFLKFEGCELIDQIELFNNINNNENIIYLLKNPIKFIFFIQNINSNKILLFLNSVYKKLLEKIFKFSIVELVIIINNTIHLNIDRFIFFFNNIEYSQFNSIVSNKNNINIIISIINNQIDIIPFINHINKKWTIPKSERFVLVSWKK